jgi:serine/threonine protein kinase
MQIGNYRLVRLIGQGGFAEVYEAEHIHLKRQVAIKILSTQINEVDKKGFLKEAQTIANLNHPNIIRLLDFGLEENLLPYLIVDYAPHGNLRQRHPHGTRLLLQTILSYVKEIAVALQYAHERRIIHRDVKPENMLVGPENHILLSDFGIALSMQNSQSFTNELIAGTAKYMAPEQITGRTHFASDQYALAVVIYEWLCGTSPFNGQSFTEITAQHMFEPPPPISKKVPSISPALEHVIMTALAKTPGERYPNMEAFYEAFAQACFATGFQILYENGMTAPFPIAPPTFGQEISRYESHIVSNDQSAHAAYETLDNARSTGNAPPQDFPTIAFEKGQCFYCGSELRPPIEYCWHCGRSLHESVYEITLVAKHKEVVIDKDILVSRDGKCPYCGADVRLGDDYCLNCNHHIRSPLQHKEMGTDNTLAGTLPSIPIATYTTRIEQPGLLFLHASNGEFLREILLDKLEMFIGRVPAPICDISLPEDKLISRLHATIRYKNEQYVLIDKHSANGTFVNGQQVDSDVPFA